MNLHIGLSETWKEAACLLGLRCFGLLAPLLGIYFSKVDSVGWLLKFVHEGLCLAKYVIVAVLLLVVRFSCSCGGSHSRLSIVILLLNCLLLLFLNLFQLLLLFFFLFTRGCIDYLFFAVLTLDLLTALSALPAVLLFHCLQSLKRELIPLQSLQLVYVALYVVATHIARHVNSLEVELPEKLLSVFIVQYFVAEGHKGGVDDVTPEAANQDAVTCLLFLARNK